MRVFVIGTYLKIRDCGAWVVHCIKHPTLSFFIYFYLLTHERHRERETETQAEGGEAGSMQKAGCGT